MATNPACRTAEHALSRRSLLGGLGAGALGMCGGLAATPGLAEAVKSGSKRVLVVFLHGGVSQLESWDPKPGTVTGGPFRAIPTSVPGMHISELLPHTAQQMHRLSIIRSLDTKNGDDVMNMLKVLKEQGTTILMVTHSPEHGARADRIIEMLDGEVVGGDPGARLSVVADNTSASQQTQATE